MPIKLKLAKPDDKESGAKLFVEISTTDGRTHQLKLHQDSSQSWHPELEINTSGCQHENMVEIQRNLTLALSSVIDVISGQEFSKLSGIAEIISK